MFQFFEILCHFLPINKSVHKDRFLDVMKVNIRDVMVRVKKVFPEGDGLYERFGTKGMDALNDVDLIRIGFRVVRMANFYLDDLAPKGLTQPIIDALEADVKKADDAYNDQQDAISLRYSTTRQRINIANEVYGIVVELFDYGKTYWVTRNAAYYKDYVIYNTPDGLPPIEEQFGSAHGIMKNSVTMLPPANGLVTLDGVDEIIEVDEDGAWECLKVPVTCTHGHATADDCANREFNITIHLDKDTDCNILMDPTGVIPPDEQ